MSKGSILVIDDKPQGRRLMRSTLVPHGYEVSDVRSGEEALDRILEERYDVALLECDLPGKSGTETCIAIRATGSRIGIIMMSGRNTDQDKVEALEAGADDYVLKPFSMPELLARVAALIRRRAVFPPTNPLTTLQLGETKVNFQSRMIVNREKQVPLTFKEYEILSYLAAHPNKTISGDELAKTLWTSSQKDKQGSLRVIINRLRNKIEPSPAHPRYLITEPWFGYRIQMPE